MSLNNLSLLYVEDEEEIRLLMKELLEDDVSILYLAQDGEEGLRMYDKYKPDIVVSDIYMPKLDGLNMSEIIKNKFPEQSIILLTAFNNIGDLKKAIDIGIDNFINKPILSQEQLNNPLNKIATKIKQKRDLKLLNERVEHLSKFAAIGEILGLITHQLKQPLSTIAVKIASIEIKRQLGTLKDEDMSEFIDITSERIQFLAQTINDFSDYLKPKDLPRSFELSSVFNQVNMLIGAKISMQRVTLVVPQIDIMMSGYHNKLLHVIINIINNSCDALSNKNDENKYIFVDVSEEEGNCHISIKDTAGGINQNVMSNIFEPYFTTKDDVHGTGLGLYMASEFIVGHMNGKLLVENVTYEFEGKEFRGAKFDIIVPINLKVDL